jgi:hypothetical protein
MWLSFENQRWGYITVEAFEFISSTEEIPHGFSENFARDLIISFELTSYLSVRGGTYDSRFSVNSSQRDEK